MFQQAGKVMTQKFLFKFIYLPLALAAILPCAEVRAEDPDQHIPENISCPGENCDNKTLIQGDMMAVNEEGIANGNTVGDGGKLAVNSGGITNNTTVSSGGEMAINSGGMAATTEVNGGKVDITDGGKAENITINSGTVLSQGETSKVTVNSPGLSVPGGEGYKGFEVSNTGVAYNTTVDANGYMLVKEGGEANNTVINGGTLEVLYDVPGLDTSDPDAPDAPDAGDSEDTTAPAPEETGTSTVNKTTVNSGNLNIGNGGIANDTTVNQNGVMNVNEGGTANRTTVDQGTLNINNGGNANDTTVSGGTVTVNNGGSASNTIISGGMMTVNDGGNATTSVINDNGTILAKGSAYLRDTTVNEGSLVMQESSSADGVAVKDGGLIDGTQTSGTINGLNVSGTGSYHLTTDSKVTNANLYGKHYDSLFNNGVGSGIIVGSESQLQVLSNARLDGTIVQQDGSVDVKSNAVLNNTTATGNGNISLEANAKADGTVLKDNSSMQVSGSIHNTVVSSAGHSTAAGNQLAGLELNNGATAGNTIITGGGTVLVKNGSTATDTQVNGGSLTAESGSILNNLAVTSGGILSLDGGATLNGDVTVTQNAQLGGSYDYNKILTDAAISSLTVVNGVNAKFANDLTATEAGKSLTFADGSYQASSDGANGSTTVKGWDAINIGGKTGAATLHLAGDLALTDADKALKINSGSVLDTSGVETINILGSVINAGELNLVSPGNLADDKNNTTTIAGNYVGEGNSKIILKVDPGNNSSDKLVINGDVIGSTDLTVKLASAAKPTEKILFLEAPNDNPNTGSNFNIWRVNSSPYLWDTSNSGNKWYMDMVNVGGKIGVYSEVMAYMGLPNAALEQTRSMVYNVINKVNLRNNNLVDNRVMHSPEYRYYSKGIENYYNNYNFWAMPIYHTISNESGVNYEADIMGGEAGIDLYNDSANKAGVFLSYRQGSYDFDGKADKFFARYGSTIDIDSYAGGAYFRHNWQNAWALALVYGGVQQADIKTKDNVSSDTDATEFGASIAGGYVYNINYSFNIEPSAVINLTSISYDDAKDVYAKSAEFDTLTLIEADLGVKFENTWNLDSGYAKAYIRPSVLFNSVSGDEVKITNFLDNSPEIDDGAFVRLEIGGSADLSKFFSMYSTLRATAGGDYQDLAVTAGLNYVF